MLGVRCGVWGVRLGSSHPRGFDETAVDASVAWRGHLFAPHGANRLSTQPHRPITPRATQLGF